MNRGLLVLTGLGAFVAAMTSGMGARAGEAVVTVGHADDFAAPPPVNRTYVIAQPPPPPEGYVAQEPEDYRSPFRFSVGPAAVTTGRALGLGMGTALDIGRDSVGFRIAAAWLRGEPSGRDPADGPSPLSGGLAQYTGEFTIDLHKRGPLHPVVGLGFGLAHVYRGSASGDLGVGTGRLALEYALGLDDADVRLGAGVTGVLPGPADDNVGDVHGYALVGLGIGVGF
jgi:hypothetical protein